MNLKEFLKKLKERLSSFEVHSNVIGEIADALKKSGNEVLFLSILLTRLQTLDDYGIEAVRHSQFELLGQGVFSMHLESKQFNVRILYMFSSSSDPILLHAFYERAGHSATDYTGKIKLARQRFAELKEAP